MMYCCEAKGAGCIGLAAGWQFLMPDLAQLLLLLRARPAG